MNHQQIMSNTEARDRETKKDVAEDQRIHAAASTSTAAALSIDLGCTAEETMNRVMALLPDDLTAEYREACRFVPELVEKESNPRWFLR
jgi:hypothetical protein